MTSACQNAVRAAQSALLAHADHVAISCPENPCLVFIYLLWGVQGPHGLNSIGRLVKFIALLFGIWCVDSLNVCMCDFIKLISDNFLLMSDHF